MFCYNHVDLRISFSDFHQELASDTDISGTKNATQHASALKTIINSFHEDDVSFPLKIDDNNSLTEEEHSTIKQDYIKLTDIFGSDIGPLESLYRRKQVSDELKYHVMNSLPRVLSDHKPLLTIQTITGKGLWPHIDYNRRCSLFYSLTPSSEFITSWYNDQNSNQTRDILQTKGIIWPFIHSNDVKRIEFTTLKQHEWYIFNNEIYHGVKTSEPFYPDNQYRKALCIEFMTVGFNDVKEILKNT
jgi:hypothetical protein